MGSVGLGYSRQLRLYAFRIVCLAVFDVTGAYAQRGVKIIESMTETFAHERFLRHISELPHNNKCNAKLRPLGFTEHELIQATQTM